MDLVCNLSEFFHEAVTTAMRARHVEAGELTEFYLVNLLARAHTDIEFDQPLALKMADAMEAEGVELRAKKLRDVGDTSLYLSGFFADSLARRMTDVDYFITMGGAAYRHLSQMSRFSRDASFAEAWTELSDKFRDLVGVLNEISETHSFASAAGVMRLYERWAHTRDEDLERRLRDRGILVKAGAAS